MDRELLIELGTEELPASWLPDLTTQFGQRIDARLREARLAAGAPTETYSTPRRLTVRIARVAERQTDLEEDLLGPPVSAAFAADGTPTPAAVGFARKVGVEPAALERRETPKGVYLAYRRQVRGRSTVDVLPDVLAGALRDLQYPRQMRWDASLHDGKGELLSGRPIRWILFLYGGRVVPFTITRTPRAAGPGVQDVQSGAVTYGHRFLTTSGRAGRAIRVKGFDDYRRRLAEHFVVLERSGRHDRIARELDAAARRRNGRVASGLLGSQLLREVPDLVEYPSVVVGSFDEAFLTLPEEVLTTTMIHHQHFFPLVDTQGRLLPSFLAVLNMQPAGPEQVAGNLERVLTARLRDAQFFFEADRRQPLESRLERLGTVLFHKALGSYREKAARLEPLARWVAAEALEAPEHADHAATAGRLAKADLATDMVRELTELQGVMGGIYARADGHPEPVWRAIAQHYLPVAMEEGAPPSRNALGTGAVTWAAVSMADRLDTLVGLFMAGERPTGSRDPYGLRRAAQGLVRLLMDLPDLTGCDRSLALGPLVARAAEAFSPAQPDWQPALAEFLRERVRYVLEHRGADVRNVRAVTHGPVEALVPLQARRMLQVLPEFADTPAFQALGQLFKRVRNIARQLPDAEADQLASDAAAVFARLSEPAERALYAGIETRRAGLEAAARTGVGLRQALASAAELGPLVSTFFDDVLVMADDPAVRQARLLLMKTLERLVLQLADAAELVAHTDSNQE